MPSKTPPPTRRSNAALLKKLEAGRAFVKTHAETLKPLAALVGGLIAGAMKKRKVKKAQTRFEQGMEQMPPEADPLP